LNKSLDREFLLQNILQPNFLTEPERLKFEEESFKDSDSRKLFVERETFEEDKREVIFEVWIFAREEEFKLTTEREREHFKGRRVLVEGWNKGVEIKAALEA
jgi:hypothetical protein